MSEIKCAMFPEGQSKEAHFRVSSSQLNAPHTAPSFRGPRLWSEKSFFNQNDCFCNLNIKYAHKHIHTFFLLCSVLRTEYPRSQRENMWRPFLRLVGPSSGPWLTPAELIW